MNARNLWTAITTFRPWSALTTGPSVAGALTVAAINGSALGGGFEVALACDYRIAAPDAKVGLPEVHLGILPGAGGTQRLPRIAGVEFAADAILSGKPAAAAKAHAAGAIDRLAETGLLEEAIAYACELVAEDAPSRNCAEMDVDTSELPENFFADLRQSIARRTRAATASGSPAKGGGSRSAVIVARTPKSTSIFNARNSNAWALRENGTILTSR